MSECIKPNAFLASASLSSATGDCDNNGAWSPTVDGYIKVDNDPISSLFRSWKEDPKPSGIVPAPVRTGLGGSHPTPPQSWTTAHANVGYKWHMIAYEPTRFSSWGTTFPDGKTAGVGYYVPT